MKKIYTFTLDGDDYPSSRFNSNLRLFAHMLYEAVYNYDDIDNNPLNINQKIKYNNINNMYGEDNYYLDSDIDKKTCGFINYEPFIVGGNTFCFTVRDELINRSTINDLMNYVSRLLKFNYTITVNEFSYIARDKDDERYRYRTIKTIFQQLDTQVDYRSSFVRRLVYPNVSRKLV